jgi:uncharacterized membrane protein
MQLILKRWWWLVLTGVAVIIILLAIIRSQNQIKELDQRLNNTTVNIKTNQ